jgi:hypothetical protein
VRTDALGRWTINVRRPLEAMSPLEADAVRAAWASHFQPLVQVRKGRAVLGGSQN